MKKILLILMALFVAVTIMFAVDTGANAYGDSVMDATTVSMGKTYSGTISETNPTDVFSFTLSTSGALNFSIKAQMQWIYFTIYDANGNELREINPQWNSTTKMISVNETIYLTSGYYYIGFQKDGDRVGKYNFSLSFKSSGESFKETQGGSNDNIYSCNDISLSKTYKGMIATNDETDFYKFRLPSTGALNIQSKVAMEWIYCHIFDADGNNLWEINPKWNETSKVSTNNHTLYLTAGDYYIDFEKDDASGYSVIRTGNYSFKLTFKSSGESFKETKFGTNNDMYSANNIKLNTKYKGAICLNDSQDMYKFTVGSNKNIPFMFESTGMKWIYIKLFDANGNEIKSVNPIWNETSKKITLNETLTFVKGTYYLSILKDGDRYGNYNFSIGKPTVKVTLPGKTSSLKATPTENSVKLTWKAVSGATGYRVYQYDYKKKASDKLATITGTSYTVKNLKSGTKYRFSVKAYKKVDGKTYWSNVYTIVETNTLIGQTSSLTATQTTSSVTLKWNKVVGATGYRIYTMRKGEWKKLVDTTKLTYTENKLNSGSTFKYRVKAYTTKNGKTVWATKYKEIETSTKPATSTLKVASSEKGKAILTWSNPSGESGFEIYYSTKKDSGFKKIATTKANSTKATVSKLQSKKTYYFKVRSFKTTKSGKAYSAYSAVKGVKVK